MTARFTAVALAATLIAAPLPAQAWETSTHTGLAEQAALAAGLDTALRALGLSGGLFEPLVVPPADAPELSAALTRHSPSAGFTPDARGRQSALSWLLAGAAIADANPTWAANHFYDPHTGAGWRRPDRGIFSRWFAGDGALPRRGVPAIDWVTSPDNPLALAGFLDQYEKALRAASPGERSRHWAGALVAAGAVLHVLGDLAVPSRVRGDAAAHVEKVGFDHRDRGSRFERLAAIAWGRLGVPTATTPISLPSLRAYLAAADGPTLGLAPRIASHYFSAGTLPRPVEIGTIRREQLVEVLGRALARPAPQVPRRLNLMAANQPDGTTLRDDAGVCLARYRVAHGRLTWALDDECQLEQAAAILPIAGAYQAGLLRWLFRGDLRLTHERAGVAVAVHGAALGKGELTLLAENSGGIRTAFHRATIESGADGAMVTTVAPPAGARRIIASFRGLDGAGEPLVAAGLLSLAP